MAKLFHGQMRYTLSKINICYKFHCTEFLYIAISSIKKIWLFVKEFENHSFSFTADS